MKNLKQNYGYAVFWKEEAKKEYAISSYRRVICEYPFRDAESEEEYSALCIFGTLKLAKEFTKNSQDWEIIKIKLTPYDPKN